MSSIHRTLRIATLAFLCLFSLAQAQEPSISSVMVSNDRSLTIDITGLNLTNGGDAVVRLGDFGTLSIDAESSSALVVSAGSPIPSGDYVLSVTTSSGTVTYDLTIGTNDPIIGATNVLPSEPGNNTSAGTNALASNTTGVNNSAFGVNALRTNTDGIRNTATGVSALRDNESGNKNTAIGVAAMRDNQNGNNNTAIGEGALKTNTAGNDNIAVGSKAGEQLQADNNIAIGNPGDVADANTTRIGDTQTRVFLAGINNNDQSTGEPVYVGADGQLGTGPDPMTDMLKDAICALYDDAGLAPEPDFCIFIIPPITAITEIIDSIGDGAGNTLVAPRDVAVDSFGNAYVSGSQSNNVFKVTPGGVITEIIDATGDGVGNQLLTAQDVAVDGSDNVYVVGSSSDNAFKIDMPGTCSTGGTPCVITEIIDSTGDGAGNTLDNPYGVAVDNSDNVYVTGYNTSNVFKVTPGGTITEIIDSTSDGVNTLIRPMSVVADGSGNVYLGGQDSDNVFKVTPGGTITEIIDATGDGAGNTLDEPRGVAVDGSGNVYLSSRNTHSAFKIDIPGTCSTGGTPCVITEIMDNTGDGAGNTASATIGVEVDGSGNVVVTAESSGNAFRIAAPGTCSTTGTPCVITEIIDPTGDGAGNNLVGPQGIDVDSAGNVYIAGPNSNNAFAVGPP